MLSESKMYCHKFTVGFIHVVGEGRFEILSVILTGKYKFNVKQTLGMEMMR